MGTSTAAFYMLKPTRSTPSLSSSKAPVIMWGAGTPSGNKSPWQEVQKGSLWIQIDEQSDYPCIFCKVSNDGDDDDWQKVLIVTGYRKTNARINLACSSGSASWIDVTSTSGSVLYLHDTL